MIKKLQSGVGEMNSRIELYTYTSGLGSKGGSESRHRRVWAEVKLAGINTQYSAESVGKKTELSVTIRKQAYSNESHAVVNGQKYKIDKVAPAASNEYYKLLLVRC